MNLEEYRWMIPPFLTGQLNPVERAAFEEQLIASAELRTEVEELRALWQGLDLLPKEQPSAAMRARFYQTLNALTRNTGSEAPRAAAWWKIRPAAQLGLGLAVFVMGVFAGHAADASRAAQDVAQLRGEIQSMRQMVALALLERQSAGARLEGVSWGSRVDRPDVEVSSALLAALNRDPNVNVRLSAVDALQKFASDASIRKALADSIATQESPLVQIALIDALVQIRDGGVAGELHRIVRDQQFNRDVRQRAQWGIQKLGVQ